MNPTIPFKLPRKVGKVWLEHLLLLQYWAVRAHAFIKVLKLILFNLFNLLIINCKYNFQEFQ